MSLGASGALGKALVFFGWKGLDCVREYVVPANPKSDAQKAQRELLKNIVSLIHITQASINWPLVAADMTAFSLWGSCYPTPRTWFNQICKHAIDRQVAEKGCYLFSGGYSVAGNTTLSLHIGEIQAHLNAGKFWYGISKTALVNSKDADVSGYEASVTLTDLTNGLKYFWQFRATEPSVILDYRSGIYYGTPKA